MKCRYRNQYIFLFGLLALFTVGCRDSESNAKSNDDVMGQAVPVSTITVQPSPMKDVIFLPGETEAWQDVRVAADTGGRVEWMGPQEGDTVAQNDLLAKIDVS